MYVVYLQQELLWLRYQRDFFKLFTSSVDPP